MNPAQTKKLLAAQTGASANLRQNLSKKPMAWVRWLRQVLVGVLLVAGIWVGLFYLLKFQGMRAVSQEETESAVRWFHFASLLAPWYAEPVFMEASAARRAGQIGRYERCLERARTLGYSPPRLTWEQILFEAQVGRLRQPSRLTLNSSIEQHLHDVIRSRSEFEMVAREALAKGLVQSYRLPEAQAELEAWIERSPSSFVARLWLGQVWTRLRRYPHAIESFNEALKLKPDSTPAQFSLAQVLHDAGRSAEAVPWLQECLKKNPTDEAALALMARCLRDQGDMSGARQCALRAFRISNQDALNLALLAQIDLAEDLLDDALKWAQQAVRVGPRERIPNHVLAQVLARLGREEEAKAVQQVLAGIRSDWEQYEKAKEQVLAEPLNPVPRLTIGRILARSLNTKEGIRWLLSALAIDPDHLACHEALAELYGQSGEEELAERHRERANQLALGLQEAEMHEP